MNSPALPSDIPRQRHFGRGFTLVELLLSITILSILLLIVTNVIGVVQKTWVRSNSKVSEFREARMALDLLVRNISQATLNTYWQSVDPYGTSVSTFQKLGDQAAQANNYVRVSELQFVSGPTTHVLPGTSPTDYPGHGLFFQAPFGVTNLVAATGSTANTENMVNLLSGRGYFVKWGDDGNFRPAFLDSISTVRKRFRFRLMEYSPTAEMNRIYDSSLRPIVDPTNPNKNHSKEWYKDEVLSSSAEAQTGENLDNRSITHSGYVRPVADNILCLVLSPQLDATTASNLGLKTTSIAPQYDYDSLLKSNPGAASQAGSQGTQHLLPPLVKLTMVVVDTSGGERLAENPGLASNLSSTLSSLFTSALDYESEGSAYRNDLTALETFLISNHFNYRVFTTTIVMKESRWSAN